jgi:hypothetical protein
MPRVRIAIVAVLLALAVVAAPAAAKAKKSTRTYSATVIAPVAQDSAGRTVMPVLLSPRAQLVLKQPVISIVVPSGTKPVHWGTQSLGVYNLRPGDQLQIELRGTSVATKLTLRRSGSADDFSRILKQLNELDTAVKQTSALAGPVTQATSYPRDQLRALRDQITTLQGELDGIDADVETSISRLASVRPADASRGAAVAAAQAPYQAQLTAVRDAARAARAQSDLAAEGLDAVAYIPSAEDGTAAPTPGTVPIELPIGTISTVSGLLNTLVILADQLGIATPPLIG